MANGSVIKEFSPEGEFLSQFEGAGTSIDIDAEGDIWTAFGKEVRELSDEGALLRTWNTVSSAIGQKAPTRPSSAPPG